MTSARYVPLTTHVQLHWKRNRGWPWPEDSWGLTPMFGEEGLCHSCGVPRSPQTGSLVLQGKGLKGAQGAWVPHWQFELRAKAVERHGRDGARCSVCGVWRWTPLVFGFLPPLRPIAGLNDHDVAASPEWFGDGWKAFRQIVVRRELAELIASASPQDFAVKPVACDGSQ